ncbi:Uncharacterised protein [Chlamydia trachomatis]|nr:Uncharacterised protein [Chlamydia trachomatis]
MVGRAERPDVAEVERRPVDLHAPGSRVDAHDAALGLLVMVPPIVDDAHRIPRLEGRQDPIEGFLLLFEELAAFLALDGGEGHQVAEALQGGKGQVLSGPVRFAMHGALRSGRCAAGRLRTPAHRFP